MQEQTGVACGIVPRVFAVAGLLLSLATGAWAKCDVPPYKVGKVWEDSTSRVAIGISIRLQDFAPHRLLCLATTLRERYSSRQDVSILIFSDRDASRHYVPSATESSSEKIRNASKMHALYTFDAEKREEYVLLMPDPLIQDPTSPLNTKWDLPNSNEIACNLRICHRCLLEFRHLSYPWQDGGALASGVVTLTGTISRNGAVGKIDLVGVEASRAADRSLLVNAAVGNLKSWRFENALTEEKLRISYAFVLTRGSGLKFGTQVSFSLPDRVIVETGEAP